MKASSSRSRSRDRNGRAGADIDVELLYNEEGTSVVSGLKRVSRPGLRVYVQKREIPRPYGGLGVAILTTPRGVHDRRPRPARERGRRSPVLRLVIAVAVTLAIALLIAQRRGAAR